MTRRKARKKIEYYAPFCECIMLLYSFVVGGIYASLLSDDIITIISTISIIELIYDL